jgi:hypothetical protein
LIAAVSRDFGREVREAVIPLRDGRADLAPALRDALRGPYQLRMRPFPGGVPLPPVSVQWMPGNPAAVPASALTPGLYRLEVLDSGRTASEAWILLCGPADFLSRSAEFQQAIEQTARWSDEMDAAAMRPLLRAYLESLARGNRP